MASLPRTPSSEWLTQQSLVAAGGHDARVARGAGEPAELDVQLWRAVTDRLAAERPFERVDYAGRVPA